VGAPFEDSAATGINGNQADNSAPDSGAAYIFTRTGEIWSQQAYLKASNTAADDEFGFHVALSGDTVLLPAFREDSVTTGINGNQADNSAPDSGAAYVFTRTGGVWSQRAYLKASNTGAHDWFGIVAVDGDTLIVGAIEEDSAAMGINGGAIEEDSAAMGINGDQADNSAPDSGAVYVFQPQ
jgi:trimeric autotransporter adhesin